MSLQSELDRVRAERAELDVVIAYLERRIGAPALNGAEPARTRKGHLTAATAAELVLRDAGRPLRTPELLELVQAAGAQIKDTDNLYKTLSRHPTFKREGRGLWSLSS